jgi:hypothetical protein
LAPRTAGLAGHVPAKRTILFFAKDNSRYPSVAGSMGLDCDPTISDQRIPYKIFSGIPVKF